MYDKPGPVTSCCGGGPPQHKAGLRGWDRQGACHPGLRGWDNRSPGPVYGGPLAAAQVRDHDRGLWSQPRPPDPLVGRALSPRAAEGTAAFGGQARSLVAPMCRPRPRTWVGAGPPRRGRARRTLMPSHTATGSLATVPGVSVVFAAIRCVRWLMDLHTHTFGVDLGPAWGLKGLQSDPKSSPSDILKLQPN